MGALMLAVFTAAATRSIHDNAGLAFLGIVFLTIGGLARAVVTRVGDTAVPFKKAGWGAFAIAAWLGVNAFTPQSFNLVALAITYGVVLVGYFLILLPRMDTRTPIDREHLSERLAQLLLIVMGESFLEIAISFQLGGRPNIIAITVVVLLLGITWAQYFDVLWGRGSPTTSGLLLTYLAGHAIALLGVGTASISLANVAISRGEDIFDTLYGTELTYALVLTYLGYVVIALSLRPVRSRVITILIGVTLVLAFLGGTGGRLRLLEEMQMAMVVAGVLLVGVVLCNRAIRLDQSAVIRR
jgi:low temperature requirement protein LtrA